MAGLIFNKTDYPYGKDTLTYKVNNPVSSLSRLEKYILKHKELIFHL